MTPTTASTIRAIVRLAITAKRDRARHTPMTANWFVYNAEFLAYQNAYRIAARFAKMDASR